MKAKRWFERNKAGMIATIPDQTLHSQIIGDFLPKDIEKIDGFLEELATHLNNHADDVFSEDFLNAFMAEGVAMFDEYTIQTIISNAAHEEIKFQTCDNIIEKVKKLSDIVKERLSTMENEFVIANPMVISLLQSSPTHTFTPSLKGEFKGPNYTMLVGEFEKTPIYSYLWDVGEDDMTILGYNDPDTNEIVATVYKINNIIPL